ncbi:preprotein translocase subunit YajC [Flavonifractor sp. An92]|uniref:preprotein translocase subunit YajC n=1 Tax=Flavonifractor sp. An92 TaxID=1965666 RepID=UPI000B3A41CB|nr:preprotein translocase subunit YajC [Flavonifractor sp. An92]OUN07976.1 preprotein translocase subunit YajC [Flavonifractor sp. An92]
MLTGISNTILTSTDTTGGLLSFVIPLVAMIAIFYFLLIRPENKRKKQMAKMRSELAVGDVITTIGGIVGTICAVKEETIVIETGADRVRIEFTKWAVSTKGKQTEETVK